MPAVGQNIIPHCAHDFVGFETVMKTIISEINLVATNLAFTELSSESIAEVLQSHNKELEEDHFMNLEQEQAGNNEKIKTKEFLMK